jgi:hypothetical protein
MIVGLPLGLSGEYALIPAGFFSEHCQQMAARKAKRIKTTLFFITSS